MTLLIILRELLKIRCKPLFASSPCLHFHEKQTVCSFFCVTHIQYCCCKIIFSLSNIYLTVHVNVFTLVVSSERLAVEICGVICLCDIFMSARLKGDGLLTSPSFIASARTRARHSLAARAYGWSVRRPELTARHRIRCSCPGVDTGIRDSPDAFTIPKFYRHQQFTSCEGKGTKPIARMCTFISLQSA